MDKYIVKMFPQAYRDLDHIYELALLNDNKEEKKGHCQVAKRIV